MSDQQALLDLLPEIKAVLDEQIKKSEMPMGIYLQETEGLSVRAKEDQPVLTTVGFKPEYLARLALLTGATRAAQANFEQKTTSKKDAMLAWKEAMPTMMDLRKELIDNMSFAFRKQPELLTKLDAIKEGDSYADAIQDLAELAVLGNDNKELLEEVKFDVTKCDTASAEAERMAELLGEVNGHMYVDEETKVIRDKAFTLLDELVGEIRDYGRFVFRNDKSHCKAYSSKYMRDRTNKYRRGKKEEQEAQ